MNQCDISGNDDLRFDRLVDDELSDTERRQLLASLDDEPGGWRCCALAFLEAQAWRQTMRDVPRCGSAEAIEDDCPIAAESPLLKPAKPTPYSGSIKDGREETASQRTSRVRRRPRVIPCNNDRSSAASSSGRHTSDHPQPLHA